MKASELDKIVLTYLTKKGYRESGSALQKEANVLTSMDELAFSSKVDAEAQLRDQILLHDPAENQPQALIESYQRLLSWCEDSLDLYKGELGLCRYPIFVHCYLDLVERGFQSTAVEFMARFRNDHAFGSGTEAEIARLAGISMPQHVRENELALIFRRNKYNIKMCSYASELLLSFLQNSRLMQLLGIVNQYLNIHIYHGQPSGGEQGPCAAGPVDQTTAQGAMTGEPLQTVTSLNSKSILWGAFNPAQLIPATGASSGDGKGPAGAGDDRSGATGGSGAANGHGGASGGAGGASSSANSARPEVPPMGRIPLAQPKEVEIEMRTKALREARQRVNLSAGSAGLVGGPGSSVMAGADADSSGIGGATGGERGVSGPSVSTGTNSAAMIAAQSAVLPSVCMYTFLNARDRVSCIDISNDSSLICAGFQESFLRCWSLTGEYLTSMKSGMELQKGYNPKDERITSKIVDENSAAHYKTLYGHSGAVFSTDFSPDNQFILSGSEDATVRLWSTKTWSNLVCYKGHNYPVWDVDFSPFGFYFASASHDKTARFWSSEHIYPLRIFAGHLSDVECVKFHPNSNYVATGSSDKTCRLWDVQTGECVRIFTGHSKAVMSVAISPDGKYLASGSLDNTARLWDLGSGKPVAVYCGHGPANLPDAPVASASGSDAASAMREMPGAGALNGESGAAGAKGSNGAATGGGMGGPGNGVYSLDFSGEGAVLASGGADCSVRIWDVKGAITASKSSGKVVAGGGMGTASGGLVGSTSSGGGRTNAQGGTGSVVCFPTKSTPVYNVQFSRQNVLLSAGVFKAPPVICGPK
eukprot:Nk52_evm10s32 gene=Nk52_evmTU10s32